MKHPGVPRRPARHRDHRRAPPSRNALELAGKNIGEVKIVASGAGAAALACLNLLVALGRQRENIFVTDIEGVVYAGRNEADGPLEGGLCAGDATRERWPR